MKRFALYLLLLALLPASALAQVLAPEYTVREWSIHDQKAVFATVESRNVVPARVRINGTKESRISNVHFENVHVTLNRWTDYPGNLFDNRPTKGYDDIEPHDNPGFYIRFSDQVTLNNCSVSWGDNIPDYFSNAIKAHDVTGLKIEGFQGNAAHPERDQAIVVPEK